uniref:Uncharacterized protein n=1 Tax=Knipowitschia caucasica TaxID=637954 RepID=A0AAV2IWS0_KNICA
MKLSGLSLRFAPSHERAVMAPDVRTLALRAGCRATSLRPYISLHTGLATTTAQYQRSQQPTAPRSPSKSSQRTEQWTGRIANMSSEHSPSMAPRVPREGTECGTASPGTGAALGPAGLKDTGRLRRETAGRGPDQDEQVSAVMDHRSTVGH